MMPNCKGCQCEIEFAYDYQEQGLYLADAWSTGLGYKKKHFGLIMINDKGKVVV